MSVYEHSRQKIFNISQHPLTHDINDFTYINTKLPLVTRIGECLDYIVNVLYPNSIGSVATKADLPLTANPNDYVFVADDGDGHGAGYVYTVIEGTAKWVKRYDVDWNLESILSETVNRTQYLYAAKYGVTDKDEDGNPITGLYAGQSVYGGDQANQNFTLYPNTTGTGGYVQIKGNFRAVASTYDLGTSLIPWQALYATTAHNGTLTLTSASITDSSNAISFGSCSLTTTGNAYAANVEVTAHLKAGVLLLQSGSITDGSGSIQFGSCNLSTTGTISAATGSTIGHLTLANGSITDSSNAISFGSCAISTSSSVSGSSGSFTTAAIGNLSLSSAQISSGAHDLTLSTTVGNSIIANSPISAGVIGGTSISGTSLQVDNVNIDLNTIKNSLTDATLYIQTTGTGLIEFSSSIYPAISGKDLGKSGNTWGKLWISGSIGGATEITLTDLLSLRNSPYRDTARTTPAQSGDTLFWDAVNGVWLASHPDTEIDHTQLTNLTSGDSGHTQFVVLAGRSGGQIVQGGTGASEDLTLESTSHATKGYIYVKDNLRPFTDATYSSGWTGIDIGNTSYKFKDVYSRGEFKGLRFENATSATLPAASATTVGRAVYNSDTKKIQLDIGGSWIVAGSSKYSSDLSFNGTDLSKDVDVSASITDARNAVWQLSDNSNNYEKMFVPIQATSASNIRITTTTPLPAGSYKLIGVE